MGQVPCELEMSNKDKWMREAHDLCGEREDISVLKRVLELLLKSDGVHYCIGVWCRTNVDSF